MRVLIAYDGSSSADTALGLVTNLTWPEGSEIMIVSVSEPIMATGSVLTPPGLAPSPQLLQEIDDWHKDNVGRAVARLQAAGLNAQGAILHGRAATAVLEEIDSWKADLVVGGSRGHGTVASLLLGSVSSEVLDHASCPVLVGRSDQLRRVVFATDGSEPSAAAEATLGWSIFDNVEIKVVSVADVLEPWRTGIAPTMYQEALDAYQRDLDGARATHKRLAEDAAERLRKLGRNVTSDVRIGDAAAETLDAAEGWKADLIVMGSRGQTGLRRLFLGSVARNVVHGAKVSVLVAHARGGRDKQGAAA